MAGLNWVRLDCTFPTNPKIIALAVEGKHRAITAYLCGLAYAGAQGNDGWIPAAALPFIHARKTDATHLVQAGLWIPQPGGWDIHDWHDYQPTNAEVERRTAKAKAAAQARWGDAPSTAPSTAPSMLQAMPGAMHVRNVRT